VNDFETVREALSDYLGSLPSAEDWTTPEDDVINAANAALDRIEAEVERLRAENKALLDVNQTYANREEAFGAEVERLRTEAGANRLLFEAAQKELELQVAEVERLRAALERIAEQTRWTTDVARSQVLSTKQAIARAALAKEEASA